MKVYADAIGLISKKEDGYSQPKDYWLAESIASDLLSDGAIGDKRSDFLAEWIENKNMIFSPENLNKIEAIYGSKFREALEATNGAVLYHTIGKSKESETILTKSEFCSRLTKLRDFGTLKEIKNKKLL